MPKDESTQALSEAQPQEATPADEPSADAPVTAEAAADSVTVQAVGDAAPAEQNEPTFKVKLVDDSDLEAPVAVSVPGLLDAEGKAQAKLDKDDRLVLTTSPVQVPQVVANALEPLPYVDVQVAR